MFKYFSLVVFVVLVFIGIYSPPPAGAACWCNDPKKDLCRCQKTGTSSFPAQFQGIQMYCDTKEETLAYDTLKSPICGTSPEIIPWCAYGVDGNQNFWVCYGANFAQGASSLPTPPIKGQIQTQTSGPFTFNGQTFGSPGINTVKVCSDNVFCCGSDNSCNQAGIPPKPNDCSPSLPSVTPPYGFCTNIARSGAGESRLWFPQLRNISALSTLLQSIFNPSPSSFNKNAEPPAPQSAALDNPAAVTTRIQLHQGLDDNTQYVSNKNNSSLKVNQPAPDPLYSFNDPSLPYKASGFCSIADTRANPGDDLLGPKITTRLTYTQKYTYPTAPHPAGCKEDNYHISEAERRAKVKCCSEYAGNGYSSLLPETIVIPNLIGTEDIYYKCATRLGRDFDTKGRIAVFTKSPLLEYIYSTLVTGPQSVLKRIFPQGNPKEFKEIPGQANFSASAIGLNQEGLPVNIKAGDGSTSPTIYIPHLGSLYDYFLQGLQKTLRPFGFSTTQPGNQNNCTPTLPTLPTVDITCQTCSISFPSPSMKSIFESAASFYKVPVSVLVGVFYNEGGLNPSWGWDESKVLAASGPSCQVTNCDSNNISNSGAKGPWQFLPGTWSSYSNAVVEAGVSDGRTPNICNLLDSTFAAAKKLGQERGGAASYAIPECIGYVLNTSQGPSTSCYWKNSDIVTAARQYLGYCEDPKHPDPKYPPRPSCITNPSTCYQQSVLDIATCAVSP